MFETSKMFFTSDTHWGHSNIIRFSNRPYRDVNHMNEELIKNWNETVPEDGIVYHLGDVSLTNQGTTKDILDRLNGKIYLICGNHEKSVLKSAGCKDRFEWIKEKFELAVPSENQLITLCHYSHRVWNKSHHGKWHLYGHSHDSLSDWGKSIDCGVDTAYRLLGEYRPFKFEEIKDILDKRVTSEVDHHVGRT